VYRSFFYVIEKTASRYLFPFASYSKIKKLGKAYFIKYRGKKGLIEKQPFAVLPLPHSYGDASADL
jgi:hypothetical protein